jgi:glycosyltransferase involved in cell wall biosynthesis
MRLSICIPTYNRADHLANCLNSIVICQAYSNLKFEVCISDNNSTDQTENVVRDASKILSIKYHKNSNNLGHARNFLKVVSMAKGNFVWLLGDDDLLLPYAIYELYKLIDNNPFVDFFYVNSYHLTTEYLNKYPVPFDTKNLPDNMVPFSKWEKSGEVSFLQLIHPDISFDFLGGMFLSVFRRANWSQNTNVLEESAIQDTRIFSHFDNTFPHVKIFAKAFAESKAYFNSKPLNVCLTGAREWSPMYPFIHSVRLIESLKEYRANGLPYLRFVYCKNFALNNFIPDFIYMLFHRKTSGIIYVNPFKLLMESIFYPNFYLSIFYFIGRKFLRLVRHIFKVLFFRGCIL